jgi:hypothetical protein
MCFSLQASVAALVVGLTGSAALYSIGTPDTKIYGTLFGYVSLMQGIDALLWSHQKCDDLHKTISMVGHLLNISQPFILAFACFLFNTKMKYGTVILIALGLYVLMSFIHNPVPSDYYCTTPRENDPHLAWNWSNQQTSSIDWATYIVVMTVIFIYGLSSISTGIVAALLFVLSALFSILFYRRESAASIWCFFIAFTPPILYALLR